MENNGLRKEGGYLYYTKAPRQRKSKIFASKFGGYAGYDSFNKPGDTFLLAAKVLIDEPFNEFYTARGEYAERILANRLKEKKINHKHYGRDSSGKKVFDIFEKNPVFGGVIDILIQSKVDEKMILECKSKNIKDIAGVKQYGADKNHVAQAQLYSYLANVKKFAVIYVFFTDEQEAIIKKRMEETMEFLNCEDLFDFDYENQVVRFDFVVDEEQVKVDMQTAYEFFEACWNENRVPIETISQKNLTKLGFGVDKGDIFARGL